MMRRFRGFFAGVFILSGAVGPLRADEVLLAFDGPPGHDLVAARVDLTAAVRWCGIGRVDPGGVGAATARGGQPVPFQFVPDAEFDPEHRVSGTALLRLPPGFDDDVRLFFGRGPGRDGAPFGGVVSTPHYRIVHTAGREGGLPSRIDFPATGKAFESLRWQDRTHHRELGSFRLGDDPEPTVELASTGSLCTVVRVAGRYLGGGIHPDSKPTAVYDWFYFHDRPLVYVTAIQRQRQPFAWKEWHFLEMNYPDDAFPSWAGGDPQAAGVITGAQVSARFSDWAALHDGTNAIGMFHGGPFLVYDGRGGYGSYLHAHSDLAWTEFGGTRREVAAWLWMGSGEKALEAIRAASSRPASSAIPVTVTIGSLRRTLRESRARAARTGRAAPREDVWRLSAAEQLERRGRYRDALGAADGRFPSDWVSLSAGDLALALERTADGFRLLHLMDLDAGRPLLARDSLPLFQITLRRAGSGEEAVLCADRGWGRVESRRSLVGGLVLRWSHPTDERMGRLSVAVEAQPERRRNGISWSIAVTGVEAPWSVWTTAFPRLSVAEPGPAAEVFLPRGAGEVARGAWTRPLRFAGTYPSGWTAMPFMAAYDRSTGAGVYVALHDRYGGTKDVRIESRPDARAVDLEFSIPAPGMGRPGNGYRIEGAGIWRLLRGDWFDAATMYREWVGREARWQPEVGAAGREDTPRWMRELSCWAMTGGSAAEVVPITKEFQAALGLPVGLHWYNWHQIPFDNDYPHYFPAKDGFAAGVAELRASGVRVMPYINGRLWDTRDRGTEEREFPSVARPATAKDTGGQPFIETYSSKESDGSPVRLAVMCPSTDLWKFRIREIVLRLMNECGVDGVYIDQVAAAQPVLCMDGSHGHPPGGGHWWTESYWDLLGRIRRGMPEGRMLTTECNGEPYTHCFDGYLTWHWQYDGQVPAFPAIYGGAIQMFGRAYREGPTKDLALRMKAGQQLVFGEQIGWLHPGVVREKDNLAFLREVVRLRARLVDYFVAGRMLRPPRLEIAGSGAADMPRVTADWQWSGVWPVTTDALLTGAWHLPRSNRVALFFVNVGETSLAARLEFDAGACGLPTSGLTVRTLSADEAGEAAPTPPVLRREIVLPAKSARAWEIMPK